jgi:hypothetical protein
MGFINYNQEKLIRVKSLQTFRSPASQRGYARHDHITFGICSAVGLFYCNAQVRICPPDLITSLIEKLRTMGQHQHFVLHAKVAWKFGKNNGLPGPGWKARELTPDA